MNDFYTQLTLDKNSSVPLYRQLGDAIRVLIEEGQLPAEMKLPPIRKMAGALNVNNMTVISAYKYLERGKWVYSTVGSGTYVSRIKAQWPEPILRNQYSAIHSLDDHLASAINFADAATDVRLFPVDAFKRAFDRVLDRDGGRAFDYQESQGYAPLREALCAYLDEYAVKTTPDRIQIISGAQQGIDILSKAMLFAGDVVIVEKPTFYGAVGAFLSRGAQVLEMDLLPDGPDMEQLEAMLPVYKPKCLYVMPNFQTPTSVSYSLEKKRQLLELAYKYDVYIIEEDNQGDFYYDKRSVPLKALDYRNHVVYVKSFSKILMPGLRMGFMALPRKLAVTTVKYNTDIATSGFLQRAFDRYLRDDDLHKHCAYMRKIYARRYQTMLKAINGYLSAYTHYTPPNGGLSFWLELHENIRAKYSMETIVNRLMRRKVIITPGAIFSMRGEDMPYFRISFAAVEADEIREGVQIIASVLRGDTEEIGAIEKANEQKE